MFLPPTTVNESGSSGSSSGSSGSSGRVDSGAGSTKSSSVASGAAAGGMSAHASALKTHLCDIVNSYFVPLWVAGSGTRIHTPAPPSTANNSIYMINLIDKKGVQGKLGALWQRVMRMVGEAGRASGGGSDGVRGSVSGGVSGGQVFPRYGYHHDAVCENTASSSAKSANSANTNSNVAADAKLDRNATTHVHTVLNVSLHDMLALHCYRNSSGAVRGSDVFNDRTTSIDGARTVPVATHLLWFDYHHKCKHNPHATIDIYNTIQSAIRRGVGYSIFTHNTPAEATPLLPSSPPLPLSHTTTLSTQQHVIRTNCMDCLDRTNVMQSMVSRWVLARQLAALGSVNINNGGGLSAAQLKADQSSGFTLPDKVIEVFSFLSKLLCSE